MALSDLFGSLKKHLRRKTKIKPSERESPQRVNESVDKLLPPCSAGEMEQMHSTQGQCINKKSSLPRGRNFSNDLNTAKCIDVKLEYFPNPKTDFGNSFLKINFNL